MIVEIPLTKGKVALVGEADYYKIMFINFHCLPAKHTTYAITGRGRLLHRIIMGIEDRPEIEIDHVDGDGLNNVRTNLRLATKTQNQHNAKARGDYRGVTFNKREQKFKARIQCGLTRLTVGTFDTAEEAAKAYDKRAKQLHGAFARLNFPEADSGTQQS